MGGQVRGVGRGSASRVMVGLVASGVLLVAGCGGADGGDEGDGGLVPLNVAMTSIDTNYVAAILLVAEQEGWFTEAGIDVTLSSGSGGGNTLRLMTTGEADMAFAGGEALLNGMDAPGSDYTIVGGWYQANQYTYLVPEGHEVEPSEATISGAGAGSTSAAVAEAVAAEFPGMQVQEVGAMGDSWAAARSGAVDAGWGLEPFVTERMMTDGAEVLLRARDVIGDFPTNLIGLNNSFAESDPETVTAFFEVVQRAFDYVLDDPAGAAEDLASVMSMDAEVLEASLQAPGREITFSLEQHPDGFEVLSDLMVSAGAVEERPDWGALIDQQYLPEEARAEF